MTRNAISRLILAALAALSPVCAQQGAVKREWRFYAGDAGSTKYSPLDQINAANVKQLEIAWRWKAENFGPRPDYNWEVKLLFGADGSGLFNAGPGAGGKMFRAIDKKTGAILHELALPASTTGVPMTYMIGDKQYIVVATGARGTSAELVALAIP